MKFIFIVISVLFLNACSMGTSKYPNDIENYKAVTDLVKAYVSYTRKNLMDPGVINSALASGNKNMKGFKIKYYRATYVPIGSASYSQLLSLLEKHCQYHYQGKFQNNWCSKDEEPIYRVMWRENTEKTINLTFTISALEKADDETVSRFNTYAYNIGYASPSFVKVKEESDRIQREFKIRNARLKREAELARREMISRDILAMPRGSALCQENNNLLGGTMVTVGFIEDKSASKIKILIANMHLKGAPNLVAGGFQQSVIWDYPYNWFPCNVSR